MENEFRWIEIREESDLDDRILRGTVVRFGQAARIADMFDEVIEPGALKFEDVILNVGHDRRTPLSRTGAGLILRETTDDITLEARIAETQAGNDAIALVRAKVLRGFSIEMTVLQNRWSAGGTKRTIRSATMSGIGLVDRPAYPESTIRVREKVLAMPRSLRLWL